MNTLDRLYKYEEYISCNHHSGSEHGSVFTLINPKSQVLVSAPHAVKQVRHDCLKAADINTFGIAMLLHEMIGCNVISVTGYTATDPNFDGTCLYKDVLKSIVSTSDIRLCIDLHGAKDRSPYYDIDLGTDYESSWLGRDDLHDRFLNYEYLTISENRLFPANNPNTITNYCYSKLGIPSVQMELSYTLRTTKRVALFLDYIRNTVVSS